MSGITATSAARAGNDTDLVAAVRRRDGRAFEELYERYHARIAAYVRGMVKDHARAEDVTQEVFLSALRRMRDTERPIAFKPWIYEIARNACIDAYRRTSRAQELSYDAEGSLGTDDRLRLVSSNAGPDDLVECKQKLNDLCGAFGGLSETHHEILVLRELEGLSYREIGERLGMSRPAVESTLFRARRRLAEEYEELVSGRRCQRVQAIISAAAEGTLGARDQRRLARHTASCQACRVHARRLGVTDLDAPGSLRKKLAALLPIPAFLRRGDAAGVAGGHGSSVAAAQVSSLGAAAEPVAASWTKAVAAVAALAFAGAGAHVAAQHGVAPGKGGRPKASRSGVHDRGHASGGASSGAVRERRPVSRGAAAPPRARPSRSASRRGPDRSSDSPTRTGAGGAGAASQAPPATPDASHVAVPSLPAISGSATGSSRAPTGWSPSVSAPEVSTPDVAPSASVDSGTPSTPAMPSAPVDAGSVVSSIVSG